MTEDGLTLSNQDLLGRSYDCVDRIVLNAVVSAWAMLRAVLCVVASLNRIDETSKRHLDADGPPVQPVASRGYS